MTECGCIYVDPDHRTEDLQWKIVVARKRHSCDECGEAIEPGVKYERYVGIDDGKLFTHKTCGGCLSIRDAMFCSGWCWGMVIEATENYVFDVRGEISSDCLLSLTPAARLRIIGIIDQLWNELDEEDDE
jgi:hypothetical protein